MVIPTVEEFLISNNDKLLKGLNRLQLQKMLIEFAEMHRKEALKQASEKARKQFIPGPNGGYYIVNKDSILNAYSKKNIK